jgi:hypothetical protein
VKASFVFRSQPTASSDPTMLAVQNTVSCGCINTLIVFSNAMMSGHSSPVSL